jgi:hypothetical protein
MEYWNIGKSENYTIIPPFPLSIHNSTIPSFQQSIFVQPDTGNLKEK